ncbi:MAG: hydroxymethylbilane synthase [Geminicoccaceae bacterium]
MTRTPSLTIGTRGSPLALAQARLVAEALAAAEPALAEPGAIATQVIKTTGDHVLDRPLAEIGGKGLFTKEIEEALIDGRVDIAVHSYKDVPTALPDGLIIAACLTRADPRDALISPHAASLRALPAGAVVGTASLRRAAQALAVRPDLQVVPLRGAVGTRLRKLGEGEVHATFLAMAGLNRLGVAEAPIAALAVDEMLPAVAQGAIAIEARADDARTLELLARIGHRPTSVCTDAERAFLAELDGSCRTPIAAFAELDGDRLHLRGLVASTDGRRIWRSERSGAAADAARLGRDAGAEVRALQGNAAAG